ncbi:MAG: hypothetical protein JNL19_11480 [Burkholderiales bacterium]|nr:hypothetical protein [Burkholderiales bacterium]
MAPGVAVVGVIVGVIGGGLKSAAGDKRVLINAVARYESVRDSVPLCRKLAE